MGHVSINVDELILDELGQGSVKQVKSRLANKIPGIQSSRKKSEPTIGQMLRTASKKTQAISKITSYGYQKEKIKAHIKYISRRGELDLEDGDGNIYCGLKEQYQIMNDWEVDFGSRERSRNTMHLMLSTPPGSDRDAAKKAAKAFLLAEYSEHEYLFVGHSDTDHPHIHAVIKMISKRGKRLNPGKAYLRNIRQHWSLHCRNHGIDVEASSRVERGLSGQSTRSEFVWMKRRGQKPRVDRVLHDKIKRKPESFSKRDSIQEKILRRNQMIRKRYAEKAEEFKHKAKNTQDNTQKSKYEKASKLLDEYAKYMPVGETRDEQVKYSLDKKSSKPIQSEKSKALNQYYAVTQGKKNEKGVYVSPLENTVREISQSIIEKIDQGMRANERSTEIDDL